MKYHPDKNLDQKEEAEKKVRSQFSAILFFYLFFVILVQGSWGGLSSFK